MGAQIISSKEARPPQHLTCGKITVHRPRKGVGRKHSAWLTSGPRRHSRSISHLIGRDATNRPILPLFRRRCKVRLHLFGGLRSFLSAGVKGGEKVYHWGSGMMYHRHDEKELNWEPGGVRSGAGVRRSGVSQESSGSSETWQAALCRLWRRR